MAKSFAVLLAILAVVASLFYVWQHQPLQEALVVAQRQAADQGREITALRARVAELEAVREQLQQTGTELKERVEAKDRELAALRSPGRLPEDPKKEAVPEKPAPAR